MKSEFDIDFLENATEVLRAIAHPIRIVIIELLFENNKLSVKEIHTRLGIEQAVASHHLRIMKSRGVVEVSREGKNSFYSLTHNNYYFIVETLKKVI
ncbi:MAG: ArsR family transcriptional regulator [Bacteroidetes bacterium]|nr:MAG: ArsR family transcriptional regulator [Bacteroidota bacterium]